MKWQAFWMENNQPSFHEELKCLENLAETLNAKDAENFKTEFKTWFQETEKIFKLLHI